MDLACDSVCLKLPCCWLLTVAGAESRPRLLLTCWMEGSLLLHHCGELVCELAQHDQHTQPRAAGHQGSRALRSCMGNPSAAGMESFSGVLGEERLEECCYCS